MYKKSSLSGIFILFFQVLLNGQTFSGSGGNIPNNGSFADFIIGASGLQNTIDTSGFGIESVCVNINHTHDSELDMWLVAPDSTMVLLSSANGGSGDNYTNTCFYQTAATFITQGSPPFAGNYKPQEHLGVVNNGQNPNGNWRLRIHDTHPVTGQGTLLNWSITFSNNPATYFALTASNLPIVVLNTFGQTIPNDPKINIHMGIIYNGPGMINYITDSFNNFNGTIGIELRGQTSLDFPQKQYSIETRDTSGNDSGVVLLNMPVQSDWILYAPYDDKSCMRNSLTYKLSNDMGRYAVRGKYCEMILNGSYKGIYELTESIKRDINRVHIAKLTANDTIGDNLTGGYIVKIDKVDGPSWLSNHLPDQTNTDKNKIEYQMVYPKSSAILPVQQNYIKLFIDTFENVLAGTNFTDPVNGWRKYADEGSFIDLFILNEISKNVDGYRISTYFYKDKNSNGGKIFMGPAWDYNIAWHNANYCNNETSSNWSYRTNDYCNVDIPFWWKRLMLDTQFKNDLKCRWSALRSTVLDTTAIFNYIDSIATLLDTAKDHHFDQWPILGVYLWPNPNPLANTYQEELSHMKQWIVSRVAWLDANMPGTCTSVGEEELFSGSGFTVFPNPSNGIVDVNSFHLFNKSATINILDVTGKQLISENFDAAVNGNGTFKINLSSLQSGFYFIIVLDEGTPIGARKIIKL